MKTKKIISLLSLVMILAGFTLSGAICQKNETMPDKIVLEYWRIFEEQDVMQDAISAYQAKYPYVEIRYKKYRYEEYADALLEAWARDEGPDIFAVPNYWVGAYLDFAEPLPATTTMNQVSVGSQYGQEDITLTPITSKSYNIYNLSNYFVDVIADDVITRDAIYGLPYALDTLVLYYNKDLLNQANIALPPQTWEEFITAVPRLTLLDQDSSIIQAGAALGTSTNVSRAQDILALLMMQSGANMTNSSYTQITFNAESLTTGGYFPGQRALQFYTDFANSSKEAYTWNPEMTDSLSLFAQGNLAFFLGYSYHDTQIKAAAGSGLNYSISTVPQISQENRVNYANYLIEMVSNKSTNTNAAWDFIKFAGNSENVENYLNNTRKPTALKSLINHQLESNDTAVQASQVLTAQSWYHGRKPIDAEDAMLEMIKWVTYGEATIKEAINTGASQVNTTL